MVEVACVYERIGGFRVSRGSLPPGDRGVKRTLAMMRRLVHEGSRQVEVREAAIDAVRRAGVRPHDTVGELNALYRFVRDGIRFTGDIAGVETLQGPRYTLHLGAGDCDDRAVLLGSLARSIGLPVDLKFRAIGTDRRRPGRFSHVYTVARLRGREIALDPTYRETPMGRQYARPSRVMDFAL